MAAMADRKKLVQLGKKLRELQLPSSKDVLLKLLKQLSTLLPNVDQSAPEVIVKALVSCKQAIVRTELLQHKDKEVKLLVATCANEIMRIEAPEVDYDEDVLREIFGLIVSTFKGLGEMESPLYQKRVHILETVAGIKSCFLMLDLECHDEILEMFKIFFQEARDNHPANVLSTMLTIMVMVLKESETYPKELLMEILSNLLKSKKISAAANKLASELVRENATELQPHVIGLLKTVHEKSAEPWLQQNYYDVLFEIYRCAPMMFLAYAPTIVEDLVTGDDAIRVKTVELLGRVFSFQGHGADRQLVSEFAKRITDKSLNVRLATMQSARDCFHSLGADASEIIAKLEDRLQDPQEQGRMKAVAVLCDIAKANINFVPVKVLQTVAGRLRDTKAGIRTLAMNKLTGLYAVHCTTPGSEQLEWIPAKILKCASSKEFRPHGIELAFSEELFLATHSVDERSKHWVAMFSQFETTDLKVLERILSLKQRFQHEMQEYLSLRQNLKEEENSSELEKKVQTCFKAIALTFVDTSKAEESLAKLHQMKDNSIFKRLQTLLDPKTSHVDSRSIIENLLNTIGLKHSQYEFLRTVAIRCSFLLFGREHVASVLNTFDALKDSGDKKAVSSCMNLLVLFSRYFPTLMEGVEDRILNLIKENQDDSVREAALQILSKSGHCFRDKIEDSRSAVGLTLETLCLEGTPKQAKYAVSAITALSEDALKALSVLYGRLVQALEGKPHLPTVLQSLGCIAQVAMPVFETREADVVHYVLKVLLPKERHEGASKADWDSRSEECMLQVHGLKALIKSYLPHKDAHLRQSSLKTILPVLQKLLKFGSINDESKSSNIDKAHLRLAAAKALLRLSRIWDKDIPVDIFRSTVLTAQDSVFEVREKFLLKTHQYMKAQRLPHKYVSVYPLCAVDSKKEITQEAQRFMTEYIESSRRDVARLRNSEGLNLHPEYILTYLVHVLAHHPQFPDLSSSDPAPYERFYKQLFSYLYALLGQEIDMKKEENNLPAILEIFRRIKSTEDASVPGVTQNLHALCDIGLQIAKDLGAKRPAEPYKGSVRLPVNLYKAIDDASAKEDGSNMPSVLTDAVLSRFRPSTQRGQRKAEGSDDDEDEKSGKVDATETEKGKPKTTSRKGKEKDDDKVANMSEDDVEDAPKRKRGRPSKEKQQDDTPGQKKRGRPPSAKKQKVETDSPVTSTEVKSQTPKSSAKKEKDKDKEKEKDVADGASTPKRKKSEKQNGSEEKEEPPEPLPGRRIKVWWPDDKKFYRGVVKSYDPKTNIHNIHYDDGDKEQLKMSKERWQYVDVKEDSATPKEKSKRKAVAHDEPQGSSQKTKASASKSSKRRRESDDEHHQSESEKRPKVNGTVEAESSQRGVASEGLGDTDEEEPLESYRRRLKKQIKQQQKPAAPLTA